MDADELTAELLKLMPKPKKPAKAKPAKAKPRKAKQRADAFGISGKPKAVSRVNKRGTSKANRQKTAKSPRRVSTKAAPPVPRSSAWDSNFFR